MIKYYIFPVTHNGKQLFDIFFGDNVEAPQKENMIEVCGGKVKVTKDFGKTWEEVKMNESDVETKTTPEKKEDVMLPDEPIDVARKLIQATVTTKVPKCGALYSGMETESIEIPKYDVVQLQEIAEHLLAYCNAQERGCVDACCKNCEP